MHTCLRYATTIPSPYKMQDHCENITRHFVKHINRFRSLRLYYVGIDKCDRNNSPGHLLRTRVWHEICLRKPLTAIQVTFHGRLASDAKSTTLYLSTSSSIGGYIYTIIMWKSDVLRHIRRPGLFNMNTCRRYANSYLDCTHVKPETITTEDNCV